LANRAAAKIRTVSFSGAGSVFISRYMYSDETTENST
jgi:hypothetical protein